jgi:cytidyltransferase-like protein
MRIALIPGSFDPITLGHVNFINIAFDQVVGAEIVTVCSACSRVFLIGPHNLEASLLKTKINATDSAK